MVSRIIKTEDDRNSPTIRVFTARIEPNAVAPVVKQPLEELQQRIIQLETNLAEARAECETQKQLLSKFTQETADRMSKAEAAARLEGRDAGRAEAESIQATQIETLRECAMQALNYWQTRLSAWEVASLAVAMSALENMFGSMGQKDSWIKSLINQEISRISEKSEVNIMVSIHDFPDKSSLNNLESQFQKQKNLKFEVNSTLRSGDCYVELDFVRHDIGINQQSRRLFELLQTLIAQEVRQ